MHIKDYYKVMGLGPDASAEEIKHKYRQLVKQHHPDRKTAKPESEQKMKDINEAYHVLGNSERKLTYDRLRYFNIKKESIWDDDVVIKDDNIKLRFSNGNIRATSRKSFCGKGFAKRKTCRRWK